MNAYLKDLRPKIPATGEGEGLAVLLPGQLENDSDLLEECCQVFEKELGIKVATATMSRNITRLPESWTLKKSLSAS